MVMENTTINGVKVQQTNQVDGTGKTISHLVVTFFVGTHGPFQETFDLATFQPALVQQKLQDFAAKLQQIPGVA